MSFGSSSIGVSYEDKIINVLCNKKCVRISKTRGIYLEDVKKIFDFYFDSVSSEKEGDIDVVDFSCAKLHKVYGFDLFKVMFPSLAEPIGTTQQYIEFAKLSEKSVVIDLGAYSGLTSMLFDMEISKNNKNAEGKVVAVDADLKNVECIKYNLSEYKKCTGRHIEYINAAVSSFDGTVDFCCDGCLGAAVIKFVGARGSVSKIPCVKLSTIAKKYNLKRVDFIKCDIEGAEVDVFNDREFFEKYSPRMIVECHRLSNGLTTDTVVKCLKKVGYSCKEVEQIGFDLPLLECVPTFAKKTLHFLKKYLCFNS